MPLPFAAPDPACGAAGTDAGAKQGLARIDIADADDDALVHQEDLHRSSASARLARRGSRVEPGLERLRSERSQQWMLFGRTGAPVQAAS